MIYIDIFFTLVFGGPIEVSSPALYSLFLLRFSFLLA